jgi:peptidoglycan/xylan/chitin deacetylase (PgdA/CDA1 family)
MIVDFKTLSRRLILSAIGLSKVYYLFPRARGRGVIFTLHHVRPLQNHAFSPNALLEITPEFLEKAIIIAKNSGYIPVALHDLPHLLKNGNPSDLYICFTLDDGYRNNKEYAAPIFKKHNVPFTIFICPGFVYRTRTLWWETVLEILRASDSIDFDFGSGIETIDVSTLFKKQKAFVKFSKYVETIDENQAVEQIDELARTKNIDPFSIVERELMDEKDLKELAQNPLCTLGGHTMTHCNLARVSEKRLHEEIEASCKSVSNISNHSVQTFAYPYGFKSATGVREFNAAQKLGLKVAVTTQAAVIQNSDLDNHTGLKRISLNGHYQKKKYVKALLSGLPFKFL